MALDVAQLSVESASLSPLPETISKGLEAIVVLSLLSLVSTFLLLVALGRNLFFKWRRKAHGVQNQFLFLIFNLLLADFQQSIAFFINIEWLARDEIKVDTPSCFAQGWFVSVGDLASGWWAVAIGLHTFSCIALGHKMKPYTFYGACALIWAFVFLAGVIGISTHPDDIYVRAGAWVSLIPMPILSTTDSPISAGSTANIPSFVFGATTSGSSLLNLEPSFFTARFTTSSAGASRTIISARARPPKQTKPPT